VGSGPEEIAFDPNNGYVYVTNNTGGTVSVIDPNATMTCTATFTPNAGTVAGTYTISASFSGDTDYSKSSSPQTGNFSITTTLAIAATHASPIFQGGPGVITLTVTTSGATTAVATVSDTIDPSLTINSAPGCSISSQTVTCTMPTGSTSTTFTVYVTASTAAPTLVSNTATLTDTGPYDTVTNGSSTDSITVNTQLPQVDSSFTQLVLSGSTDQPSCAPGGTLTATDLLRNTSGSTLIGLYAEIDSLTQGNTLLSDSASQTFAAPNVTVTFTFHIQLASCKTFQLFLDVYGEQP
jgi:YVTN family beta-propeller protein